MAFSSIDDPSTAVTLKDTALQSKQNVLSAVYKHVFGNSYVMEEERAELATADSDFLLGKLSTRQLVRAIGKSALYKKRFFERSGPYRFIELNYKHFLGRAPESQEEISFHVQTLVNEGYDAEIDTYFDCGEYEERFGDEGVPRFIFKGTYQRNDSFNRMTILRKNWDGCSTSTVSGSTAPAKAIAAQLIMGHGGYVNGFVGICKGLPAGFRPEPQPRAPNSQIPSNPQAPVRIRYKIAENLYQVYEIPGMEPVYDPEWKKERMAVKRWNGAWY
ncbi:Phycobilisome Linker polypeptide [Gracilaria domingensis]|nr:Phycobilisome Linker polypeptide [Gracilaria domingensis]